MRKIDLARLIMRQHRRRSLVLLNPVQRVMKALLASVSCALVEVSDSELV